MPISVLIVDDDPVFRTLAARLLTAAGLVVVGEAENVAEGLSMASDLRPDAALVDIGLPDGDGFGLARQLTRLPWRPRVVRTSVEADVRPDGRYAAPERRHSCARLTFLMRRWRSCWEPTSVDTSPPVN
jgi:CheY-like chemotaxis protein